MQNAREPAAYRCQARQQRQPATACATDTCSTTAAATRPSAVPKQTKDNLCQCLADHFVSDIDVLLLDEAHTRKSASSIDYPASGTSMIDYIVLSMCGILRATRSLNMVMRLFSSLTDRPQPLVQGRLAHLPQTSKPGQRLLPRFSVHRTASVRKHHSADLPLQRSHSLNGHNALDGCLAT